MAEAAEAPKPAGNSKKLLGFAFAGFNLAVLGVGAYLAYVSTLGVTTPTTTEKEAKIGMEKFEESLRGDPVIYTMEPFNTVLDGMPRRLVRMEVNLEMLDQEGFEEVINKAPQARDSINRILNGETYTDIETVQGKLQLKNKIIGDLNAFLEKGIVKNVYFSEFIVQ